MKRNFEDNLSNIYAIGRFLHTFILTIRNKTFEKKIV
jgi:hypothetical protein